MPYTRSAKVPEAMKQGAGSSVKVAPGTSMRITFGALMHDNHEFDTAAEYQAFKESISD